MEVIRYEEPQSFDDFGMDWSDPDPRCAHYVMALRNAFLERMAAAKEGYYASEREILRRLSPWKAVNSDSLRVLVRELEYLCRFYYNLDPYAYKEDFSDFPKRMRLSDIVSDEDCETFLNANRGQVLDHGGEWLRKIKNAICRLHVVQCYEAWGTSLTRSGSEHDPPFDESIGAAMERAFGDNMPREGQFSSPPASIESWSGNNHWKCPRPDYEGDSEDNKDGYCGYAQCSAYKYTRVRRWLAGSEVDLVIAVLSGPCTTPTGYSNELATSVFDLGESGFSEGLNLMRKHLGDPLDFEFSVGNIDAIPRNEVVPQSDFDSEGNATWRRSAKRGFVGKMWTFLDYDCENGFRFRAGSGTGNTGG